MIHGLFSYLMPNNLPSLCLLPDLLVGMPVALEILRFTLVTPKAFFQLKERPGIDDFFAMTHTSYRNGVYILILQAQIRNSVKRLSEHCTVEESAFCLF